MNGRELQAKVDDLKSQLEHLAPLIPGVPFLMTVPGIGIRSATALVASVGDVHRFPSGRSFAAYLGLTPRESSSGGSRRLGPISKRGDRYLRVLLIHGARAALLAAHRSDRRGDVPITPVTVRGRGTDWLPTRESPSWPGAHEPHQRAEDTTAVDLQPSRIS